MTQNLAQRAKWTNILTAIATVVGVLQTTLTTPPFSVSVVFIFGAVLTYSILVLTAWKQFLSNDISDTGAHVTIIIAIIATVAGLVDLIPIFKVQPLVAQWIKWGISIVVLILNVLSKTLFPSIAQTAKMEELKTQIK